jgi:CelD/BcsL family acetyltransferase involved in cellulose biosynthesis
MAMTAAQPMNGVSKAMSAPTIVRLDRAQWEVAAQQFSDYSYRQNWAYGETLAAKRGAASEHIAIQRGDEIAGLADVRIKMVPVIGGGLAYISGGPLIRKSDDGIADQERLVVCLDALVREFVQRRGLTLRILAPIGGAEHNESVARCFEEAGFQRTTRGEHYRTVLLDIDRPLDVIRSSMHSHWRRHLNGAERNNLEVTFGTEHERFAQVAQMSEALRARKGFEVDLDAMFFADVQNHMREGEKLIVGIVHQNGTPVAGNITAMHGDTAVYLVGASTDAALESKASYLMHWKTLELARQRGMKWYDLGGIDPDANPGVTSFKLRTNGADVTAAGPYEKASEGVRRRIADLAERAYLRLKRGGAK